MPSTVTEKEKSFPATFPLSIVAVPCGDSAVPVRVAPSTLKLYETGKLLPSGVVILPVHLPSRFANNTTKKKAQTVLLVLKTFLT